MTIKRPEFAHSSSLMHKLRLTLSLGLLSSVLASLLAMGANAQSEPPARWLDPAQDMQNLPRDGGILFWSGDQQIAGFRNIALLSPRRVICPASPTRFKARTTLCRILCGRTMWRVCWC
jgi:hypothetical protein